MNKQVIDRAADNIRILSASMVEKAKSGHPGGAMGGADFINLLFSEFLTFDPDDRLWPFRDRFFLDPGHMSPMLYSALSLCGSYSMEDLRNFRQWKSHTPGHPEVDPQRGIENTSGPLGQGHTIAVGAAIAERIFADRFGDWTSHKIYTYISDGGIQEEISQGAGRIAGYLGLKNLIMFFDSNHIQLSTETAAVTREDTGMKYQAWGWRVLTINGNNQDEIRQALGEAVTETEKPVLIIGKTIMGKGCLDAKGNLFEGKTTTHGQPISKAGASFESTIRNLGGDPSSPFRIFPEVEDYYQKALIAKRDKVAERKAAEKDWAARNPNLNKRLNNWLKKKMPAIRWEKIQIKPNLSTREASGMVLSQLGGQIENLVVMSADLANSDKTDLFLKNTKAFGYHNFGGSFLQAGVSELTMAAIANGMALHGGIIPVCGTFFVFSDYMKPAVRLAALMELQVVYVWTHDAFRVGEDGPTHQPVEQEAQIRLLEKLKNHSGKPSMLVLRPADSAESIISWKLALGNKRTPTALLLSRQNITDLPASEGCIRIESARKVSCGAYILLKTGSNPKVVLLGNGSEVATLVEASEILKKKYHLDVQIVSVPSEGLFRQQNVDYQREVIPPFTQVFGLTAGLPGTLQGLVGSDGLVWGLDHFGYSAPAEVLDEKFGFTPKNVINQVLHLVGGLNGSYP
ncbi:MAG: transketolase [Porphyromonadaceae bacterium]|nr:MAG: transketolase [Porphyromonadaceae bacterium]